MKTRTEKTISFGSNSFGQATAQGLGFEKNIYTLDSYDELISGALPSGRYGAKANDYLRDMVNFEEWEDPKSCKFVSITIEDGKISSVEDVSADVYNSELNYIDF